MTYFTLTEEERDAYDAPFPAYIAMAAPRTFPGLANTLGGKTQSAWEGLETFEKPFLTIWAGNDPGKLGQKEVQKMDSILVSLNGAVRERVAPIVSVEPKNTSYSRGSSDLDPVFKSWLPQCLLFRTP